MKKREFFKGFIEFIEDKKPYIRHKTYLTYEVTFRYLQDYFFKKDVVNEDTLKDYIEWRMTSSKSSARKDAININSFLRYSKLNWKLRKPKLPQSTPKFLSKKEVFILQKGEYTYDPEVSRMVIFALDTGMRLNEILHLRMESIDFDNELITISNDKDFTTKSGKIRLVPMTDRVLDLLLPPHNEEYVFRFPFKNKERYVQKHLKKYLAQLGLSSKITWHQFRHTFASRLVRNGQTSIQTVSELMGHADIKTTLIYAKLDMETKKKAINSLE